MNSDMVDTWVPSSLYHIFPPIFYSRDQTHGYQELFCYNAYIGLVSLRGPTLDHYYSTRSRNNLRSPEFTTIVNPIFAYPFL